MQVPLREGLLQEQEQEQGHRHRHHHQALASGLEALGISFVVDAEWRLPQLNSVYIPAGLDDAAVRQQLLREYNLEIGAGLGPLAGKVWRIGLMGHSCREENVRLCLNALGSVLNGHDPAIPVDAGTAAATAYYGSAS